MLLKNRHEILLDYLQLLSRTLQEITKFQSENHLFKSEFIFRQLPIRDQLVNFGRVINGHFLTKNQSANTLLQTGIINKKIDERKL
jgi:hypothetical protein